MTEMHIT